MQVKANNSVGFSPRELFGAAVLKGIIYVVAGWDQIVGKLNDVWSSADGGKTWLKVLANAPFAKRYGLVLINFENKLFVLGGTNDMKNYADTWISIDVQTWLSTSDLAES